MLKLLFQKFFELPTSVQRAYILVLVAWTAQFLTAYLYILRESIPPQFSALGAMLFMALVFAKKWGRIMCIFFTAWAIVWYLMFFVIFLFARRFDIVGIVAVNIALFAASLYYLWKKETAKFFAARAAVAKAKAEKNHQEYQKQLKAFEKSKQPDRKNPVAKQKKKKRT